MSVVLDVTDTNTPWLKRVSASVDGGVSYQFVGHLQHASFVTQPNFLQRFDAEDQAEILAAVAEAYPDKIQVECVLSPECDWTTADQVEGMDDE
jgi:hypothetical protein